MKVCELFDVKKQFTNLSEWKSFITEKLNGTVKSDPYDDSVFNATNSRGHVIGYFNQNENYGEVKN